MRRIMLVLVSLTLLGGAARGKGDTARYARRVVTRYIEQELSNLEWGASPSKIGATAYRIRDVAVDEKNVRVTVAFRAVFEQSCDSTHYYRPARWISRTYDIPKTVLGTPEMRWAITDDIMDRERVLEIERSSLYFVIAGTFRSQTNAERYASQLHADEFGFSVLGSSDYAGLRPDYWIVQHNGGFSQTDTLSLARQEAALLATHGIEAYVACLPPLRKHAEPPVRNEKRSR
jgi:hypothetical protein